MSRHIFRRNTAIVFTFLLVACAVTALRAQNLSVAPPISNEKLLADIRTLSSNDFQGRGPGTKGEDVTISYIEKQFRDMGLEPGNPDGSYLQAVPLVGIRPDPSMALTFTGHGQTLKLAFEKDFVAQTRRVVDTVHLDADMIFAGYGVQAPEYKWDDFKGVDVKGKVIVVLINDPPVADQSMFGGKAMTYYGRWTYKFEKAAQLGAAGCLIVHETEPAAYPWEVVRDSWGGESFNLSAADKNMHRAAVEGWITHEQAQALFKAAGLDYEVEKKKAVDINFHPVPLGMKAQLDMHNTLRTVQSHNVIAKRTGSDPALKNQYVIYSAHWDHFGIGPEMNGDKIYHGARDNGSGVAALLEIARAYAQLKPENAPKRSIVFLSVTAEEQGLLGSEYYAAHPLYPLSRTAANINMDALNVWGKTKDITEIGKGQSSLDEIVADVAEEQGRTVRDDPEPEKGSYYRSDHFNFAKVGVPAFDPDPGIDFVGKPAGYGMKVRNNYTTNDYHKPSDVIKPDWDLSGLAQDSQLYFLVGLRVADTPKMPEWKAKSEFKAIREASLKSGK